jgi:hypothetical protein
VTFVRWPRTDAKLIRIGEMLPSEEIDMSVYAALLEAAYAQRTLDEARAPSGISAGEQPPKTAVPAGRGLVMKHEPGAASGTKPAESSHSGSVDTVGRVELKATVGKAGFSTSIARSPGSATTLATFTPRSASTRWQMTRGSTESSYGTASSNRSKKEPRTSRSLWNEPSGGPRLRRTLTLR